MKQTNGNERKQIGSVQRALEILDLFSPQHAELGTTEIAKGLSLAKSTVAGLVYTLHSMGYLDQNPENRKYRLGLKLPERAFLLLNQLDVRHVAIPHLEALRDHCNESINLAIRDGDEVVYIHRLHGAHPLAIRVEIGKRAPLHSTALGKAILSLLPDEELAGFVRQYPFLPITPKTITDPQAFLDDLRQTRTRGYAIDDEENEIGGRCLAAPIRDHTGRVVAAISVSVPLMRLPVDNVPGLGSQVQETALAISRALGYIRQ